MRSNDTSARVRASFHFLAEHYLKASFGAHSVRWKSSANTIPVVAHYVRDYLIRRFGAAIAEDIKPLEIHRWLKSLNETGGLGWTTIAMIRGIMLRIYKIGILPRTRHEASRATRRDAFKVHLPAIIITPAQTVAILKTLPSPLHYTLVLACAATALRSSEILALRWSDDCGEKEGFEYQPAGPTERTEKPKPMRRTASSRRIRY